jgi:sugar lactone lactonase YvrE
VGPLVRTRDGKSLIVAETAGRRLLRLWFAGDRAGASEAGAQLPGFSDNLCADAVRVPSLSIAFNRLWGASRNA